MTTHVFDVATSLLQSRTDATGHVTSFQHDANGRPVRVTEPEGNATQFTYDVRGNITETRLIAKPNSGVADIATSASYPCASTATCDKPEWVRDGKGGQTDFTYDATTGNVTSVTAPANAAGVRAVTNYGYADVGGVSRVSRISTCLSAQNCPGAASERVVTIGYDANGLPTTVTDQAGDGSVVATTSMAYDATGNRTSVDGPLPGAEDTTHFRYDAARQLIGQISPDPDGSGALLPRAVRTTYDGRGNATLVEQGNVGEVSDAGWAAFAPQQQLARTYDGLDRPLTETLSGGGTVFSVTQNSYAGLRLDCSVERLNSAEWATLPPSACTTQSETPAGPDRITKYSYDAAGRTTQVTAGFGTPVAANEVTTAYTGNGQTASVTDANGNVTTSAYDGLDRLTTTTYPDGSTEGLAFDANGNVTSRVLRDGNTISYGYDALNRVISVTVPKLHTFEFDRSYTYDLAGNLTRAADSNGHFADLAYDALGRQISEASNFSTRQFGYDAAGRRTRLTWQDGMFVSYDHFITGEVSAIRENGDTVLASYGYDNLGRRVTLSRGNGVTTSYTFDAGSRLAGLTHDLASVANDVTKGFAYNAVDQIVSRTMSNPGYAWNGAVPVSRAYTTNPLNQYTQAGDVTFGYDGRGNLTVSGATAYGYTSENRLATGPGGYLAYDPLGRLHDENGQVTLQYDGTNLITEQTAAGIARRYVFGPGTDEPIVWYEGAGLTDKRWFVADERGSIVAVTDAAGNPLAINRYDESGIPASTNMGRFQYTGQKWLAGFGLYDYKARAYSPTLGRFMQTDPIGYGDGMNMYAYAGNDPINYTDPSGQFIFKAIGLFKLVKALVGAAKVAKVVKVVKVAKVATQVAANGDIVVTGSKLSAAAAAKAAAAKAAAAKVAALKAASTASAKPRKVKLRPDPNCIDAISEDGAILYSGGSGSLIVGGGITGSWGTFTNQLTGTRGSYWSIGGGGGADIGGGAQLGYARDIRLFIGGSVSGNLSAFGAGGSVSGALSNEGVTYSGLSGSIAPGPWKFGGSVAASGTKIYSCAVPAK